MPETQTARIDLNEQGLLIVRINDGASQSLADAKENLALAVSETRGTRRPLLIDIRTAQPLDADARHHYSGQTLVERFSALALLVEASSVRADVRQRVPARRAARHPDAAVLRRSAGGGMAQRPPVMTPTGARVEFARDRVAEFLKVLEQMAAGDTVSA